MAEEKPPSPNPATNSSPELPEGVRADDTVPGIKIIEKMDPVPVPLRERTMMKPPRGGGLKSLGSPPPGVLPDREVRKPSTPPPAKAPEDPLLARAKARLEEAKSRPGPTPSPAPVFKPLTPKPAAALPVTKPKTPPVEAARPSVTRLQEAMGRPVTPIPQLATPPLLQVRPAAFEEPVALPTPTPAPAPEPEAPKNKGLIDPEIARQRRAEAEERVRQKEEKRRAEAAAKKEAEAEAKRRKLAAKKGISQDEFDPEIEATPFTTLLEENEGSGTLLPSALPKPAAVPAPAPKPPGLVGKLGLGLRDFLLLIISFVPALATGWIVAQSAVNVPYGDDWDRVELLKELHAGTLTFQNLHEVENGQRQVVPKAIFIFMSRVTGGDVRAEVWVNFAIACFASVGLLLMLANTLGGGMKLGVTMLVANLILFSPLHWQQLLSAHMAGTWLPLCCLIWACFIATRDWFWWLRIVFCLALGLVGTYSLAHGLVIWVSVFLMVLLVKNEETLKGTLIFLGIWTLVGLFVIGDYFVRFGPDGKMDWSVLAALAPGYPEQTVADWFVLVSQSVARTWQLTEHRQALTVTGVVIVCVFIGFAIAWVTSPANPGRKGLWNRCLPWLGVGLGGLLGAALVVLMEQKNPGAVFDPAYLTVVCPILLSIVACYAIITTARVERNPDDFLNQQAPMFWSIAFAAILIHQGLNWNYGYQRITDERIKRLRAHAELLLIDQFEPTALHAFGGTSVEIARERAQFLSEHEYISPWLTKHDHIRVD